MLLAFLLFTVMAALPSAGTAEGTRKCDSQCGYPFVGIDLGVSEPTNNNYRAHVQTGATANPFAGYMFNRYLGLQGQLHFTVQEPDNDNRGFKDENQTSTLFGATAGPRISLPLGDVMELYGTGQGGYFSGLSGRLSHSAPGFSVGGGVDFNLTPNLSVGLFGRFNRAYFSPRPKDLGPTQVSTERFGEDIEWATAGVGLKWSFKRPAAPPPPPPPPPVAQAPPPVKKKIVLRGVNFDFDKYNIRPDARQILDEAVSILKEEGTIAVIVEGHTDSKGTDAYNLKLSQRRADAVEGYLVDHGISASRLRTEGFGESRPVATNDTADGRAQNRRVELHVE